MVGRHAACGLVVLLGVLALSGSTFFAFNNQITCQCPALVAAALYSSLAKHSCMPFKTKAENLAGCHGKRFSAVDIGTSKDLETIFRGEMPVFVKQHTSICTSASQQLHSKHSISCKLSVQYDFAASLSSFTISPKVHLQHYQEDVLNVVWLMNAYVSLLHRLPANVDEEQQGISSLHAFVTSSSFAAVRK